MNYYRIHKDYERDYVRHIYWLHDTISPLTLADVLDQHEELFCNIQVQRDVPIYVSKNVHHLGSRITVKMVKGDYARISMRLKEIVDEVLFKGNI